MTHFMGADRVARVGAACSAMRASGKRRNAPGAPIRPTEGRTILAASRVARRLLYAHNGAARALLAAKIASVKCVIRLIPLFPVPPDLVSGFSDRWRHKGMNSFVFHGVIRESYLARGPKCRSNRKHGDKPYDSFHGSGSGRPGRRGVQWAPGCDARIGQAPQRRPSSKSGCPDTPHRTAGRFWPPAAPTRCLLYPHNGAARALLAVKIALVKCVIISDLWYEPTAFPNRCLRDG